MLCSFIAAVALQDAPFQKVFLADGSSAAYVISCGDPNANIDAGSWTFGTPGGGWRRFLGAKWGGWNGESQLDPVQTGVWSRPLARQPWGAVDSQNRVWPVETGAIEIHANGCRVSVTVTGSPCESVRLIGSDNVLTVDARSGAQSLYKLQRPAVHVRGDRNTVSGYIEHPMCGLYVVGNDTVVQDLTVVSCAVGADVAGVWFQGGEKVDGVKQDGYYNGAALRRVTVRQMGRQYPYDWHVSGVRFDDGFSHATITDLTVTGDFMERWFNYLGSDITETTTRKRKR